MSRIQVNYIHTTEETKNNVESFLNEWYNNELFISTYTSGSTGKPKLIQISKNKMKESARMTGNFLGLKANDSALLCLSPATIAGKMMIIRAIELKLSLSVIDTNSNPISLLNRKIDFIAMVPLQLQNAFSNIEILQKIENVIIGGGEISEKLELKLKENNVTVFQTFGMTETISHVAMRKVGAITEQFYTALAPNYFSQKDNRLIIHSPLLENDVIETNDIIELLDEKHFIWKGRSDFVINSGGIKIHPEQIEKKLAKLIEVPFFISSLKDDTLGEKVVLFIESKDKFNLGKEKVLQVISKYEYPKEIFFLENFIRTESGKINRLKTKMTYK
jgi:O-succinylbenzoic acid--CoA ligase